jgi:uncharacterized protein YbaA (DUF1428 family)
MAYVDGFLLALPKKKIPEYRWMARAACKIWRDYGAIDYKECLGDDVGTTASLPFKRGVRLKRGEVLVFAWIAYRTKADRNRVNAKIMKDPRIARMMDPKRPVFDLKRMGYGGFRTIAGA